VDNVKPLNSSVVVQGQPDPGIVKMLEDLLARAKSGSIVACATAAVDDSMVTSTNWAGSKYAVTIGGAISLLEYRYMKSVDDHSQPGT
jgi:hypothetical protein